MWTLQIHVTNIKYQSEPKFPFSLNKTHLANPQALAADCLHVLLYTLSGDYDNDDEELKRWCFN